MWNNVNYVAVGRFLPAQELQDFALKHADKYGIDVVTPTHVLVNTWHVDKMVDDFKAEFPELCKKVRADIMAGIHKETKSA
jgi:hypothetical protein